MLLTLSLQLPLTVFPRYRSIFGHFQLLLVQSPKLYLFTVTPVRLITATPPVFNLCYVIFNYATLAVPFIATLPNNHCLSLL